jgi:uncharacterized protein (TIGR03067 family)
MKTRSLLVLAALVTTVGLLAARDEPKADTVKAERKKMEGNWQGATYELDGKAAPPEALKKFVLSFDADGKFVLKSDGTTFLGGTTTLDPSKKPMAMDIRFTEGPLAGKTSLAICKIEGDTLTLCRAEPGKDRPTEFASKPDSGHTLMTYKRVK